MFWLGALVGFAVCALLVAALVIDEMASEVDEIHARQQSRG